MKRGWGRGESTNKDLSIYGGDKKCEGVEQDEKDRMASVQWYVSVRIRTWRTGGRCGSVEDRMNGPCERK